MPAKRKVGWLSVSKSSVRDSAQNRARHPLSRNFRFSGVRILRGQMMPSGIGRQKLYRNAGRNVDRLLHPNFYQMPFPGRASTHRGPELQQERAGLPGLIRAACKLCKSSHLLQQFQHVHSSSHAVAACLCCKSRAIAEMRKIKNFHRKSLPIRLGTTTLFCLAQPAA